jgi:Holliday junction resolvasome RuvABC endonuclease subunit
MNNIYVGIDPSVNSTGVCISVYDDNDNLLEEKFYIVKPDKLTKKENAAESKHISKFAYLLYDKEPTNTDNNSDNERNKAINFMQIVEKVRSIIFQTDYRYYRMNRIYICQEGISYGSSTRTKSIFDLSGLNFMFREMVINSSRGFKPVTLIVATPGEIKKFATGNGNANKELLLECFKATYPDFDIPKMDDIADAYFMAKYARYYRNNNLD